MKLPLFIQPPPLTFDLLLSPRPAECALEDEVFEDGAETRMECNKCVCACGNWVCTALTCTGGSARSLARHRPGSILPELPKIDFSVRVRVAGEHQAEEHAQEGEEEEELTEEEWSRRVAELNALEVGTGHSF